MITPHDIDVKVFSRSMRGYNTVEVDEFLDEIILGLNDIMEENKQLQSQVESLNASLAQYKQSESSMLNTLESAKKLMGDISESAEKRAEIIINNAHANAEAIQKDAKESISKLTEEGENLAAKVKKFKAKYKELLEDELSKVDGSTDELIASLEREFLAKSKAESEAVSQKTEIEDTTRNTTVFTAPKVSTDTNKGISSNTVVIKEKSLEEMLMEDFGSKEGDLSRTIVVK